MNPSKYYRPYQLQGWTEVPVSGGTPLRSHCDVRLVMGLFAQKQSGEQPISDTQRVQTAGTFMTGVDENLVSGSVLRDEETGVFIRIEGDARKPPRQARAQLKTYDAQITDRSVE